MEPRWEAVCLSPGCLRDSVNGRFCRTHGGVPDDEIIRGKGLMDGCVTLEDAAKELRIYADHLEGLAQGGWVLQRKITHDFGFIEQGDA